MRVYVAGPFSEGDQSANARAAMQAGDALILMGHIPFVPHLNLFWNTVSPKDYETWMAWDLEWLRLCGAVLRLPGASSGADREVAAAHLLGIPVLQSLDQLRPMRG